MPKYRIIYIDDEPDYHWKIQVRFLWLFWADIYIAFDSIVGAGDMVVKLIARDRRKYEEKASTEGWR